MTTVQIQMHEAIDGSVFETLQAAQRHNLGIKHHAEFELRALILRTLDHGPDDNEIAAKVIACLLEYKQEAISLLNLL